MLKPAVPGIGARRQMQQRCPQQILRQGKLVLRPHGGAAGRHHGFTHQKLQLCARPMRQAKVDAGVDRLQLKIKLRQACGEVDGDARMLAEKLRQARCQPAGAKGGQNGQIQAAALRVGAQPQGGIRNAHQRTPNFLGIGLPGRTQAHGLAFTHKQIRTQPVFQRTNLPADRALRQIQLGCGSGKALVPGRGLKSTQQRHGWQKTSGQLHKNPSTQVLANRKKSEVIP